VGTTARFFVAGPLVAGTSLVLPRDVAHHALTVLRLRPGAALLLFDGRGGQWRAVLGEAGQARVIAHEAVEAESPLHLVLLQALVATEKVDWIVEKATELGVAEVHLAPAARSTVRLPEERRARRLEHWRDIIVAACAQCGRNRVPVLVWHRDAHAALQSLAGAGSAPAAPLCALLVPGAPHDLRDALARARGGAVIVAVGPEGDWSDEERQTASNAGWLPVGLGPRVLRTETAGLAALAALATLSGDLAGQHPRP